MADDDTIEEVKTETPPTVLQYDAPPPQFVAGTVVPKDKTVEEMTDAEYAQWCFEQRMPYWAIKKELLLRNPPVATSLNPATAEIGSESFVLYVTGENFVEGHSVIVFAGHDEPTTLNEDGTLSTGVNMSYWHGVDTVPVWVRNGERVSEPLEFTFTAAPGSEAAMRAEAAEKETARIKAKAEEEAAARPTEVEDNDDDDSGFDDDGMPARKKSARKKK